ncbi:MAG: ABC transporter substrate-binding protein [Calditrichaeota bacterium]|nr:ABC transporter substrate-binding protein [Calditrichota bacterium]
MPFAVRRTLTALISATLLVAFIGCGGGDKRADKTTGKTTAKVRTDAGALPDVSAELGGEGFSGEGWQTNTTYEPQGDPRAVRGGSITIGYPEFPATYRITGKDSNSEILYAIRDIIYETLIGLDPLTLEFIPGLATHWKISEDKQTYWFRINPRARFSDGSRVTARDVVATWKLQIDPGILAPYTNIIWGKFEEPVAESPYIVRVRAKEINWKFFIYFGSLHIMPAKDIALSGEQYMKDYQYDFTPSSGPYELDREQTIKGKTLVLKRRADYWDDDNPKAKGLYNFDRIKFAMIEDERLRFEKIKKGELDFYQVGRAQWWVEETDFDHVKRGLVQKRKIFNDDPQGYAGVAFNMRKPPFDDRRMRAALTHLWNREKFIKELFHNEYLFLDSYSPGGTYENPDNPRYRYDPDRAVKLLSECGWKSRNAEGWLVNNKGQMLELDIAYSTSGVERFLTVFQEDLKKVGIKLNLKQSQASTLFKMVNERNFTVHFQQWGGLFFPNPENDVSSWTADPPNTNNITGVKSTEIDSLIHAYNVEFNQQNRVQQIRRIDRILMDIQPYALAWYAPFHRYLYWNKFGYPDYYISRIIDWRSVMSLWWVDPEKEKALEAAKKDPKMQLPVGETSVMYWPEWNAKHGQKYEIKE